MDRDESFSTEPFAMSDPRGFHPGTRPSARKSNRISPYDNIPSGDQSNYMSPNGVPSFDTGHDIGRSPNAWTEQRPVTGHTAFLNNLNSAVAVNDEHDPNNGSAWDGTDEETRGTMELGAISPMMNDMNKSSLSLPGSSRPLSLVSNSNPPDHLVWELSVSTGLLTPAFSPYRHVYVLLVPPSTTEILVHGKSPLGNVLVDKHDSRIPVSLLPPGHGSQKVVVEVDVPQDYRENQAHPSDSFQYVIDVRRESISFNGPPPTSNPPSQRVKANAGVIDPHQQRYIVQYPFEAATEREMSLQPGDCVVVLLKSDSGWWGGVQAHDPSKEGWFPSTHVKPEGKTQLAPLPPRLPPRAGSPTDPFGYSNLFVTHHKPPEDGYSTKRATTAKHHRPHRKHNKFPRVFSTNRFAVYWPLFTVLMMITNTILFIITISKELEDLDVNPMLGPDYNTLIEFGARNFEDTHEDGKVYLFITAVFLPTGLFRLLFDLLFHLFVCTPFERVYGPFTTAFVYFSSGITGHLLGMIALPEWIGAGPAPALMGISAAFLTILLTSWYMGTFRPKWEVLFVITWIIASMVLGIFPGMDNWTQVGGFIGGLLASFYVLCNCGPSFQIGNISHLARVCLTFVGLMGLFLFIVLEFVLYYALVDNEYPCDWCKDATCLDAYDWCDTYRLGRIIQQ